MLVKYKNVTDVKCILRGKSWDCEISRLLSDEPKEIEGNICFIRKTETEKDLEDVHLESDAEVCEVYSVGEKQNFLRCYND